MVLSLALAAMLLVAVPGVEALAAEEIVTVSPDVVEMEEFMTEVESKPGISLYATILTSNFGISFSSYCITMSISPQANRTASVVGVKNIKLQKKVWYGWDVVATGAGGEVYNATSMYWNGYYYSPEYGATYKVTYTIYANVDGYAEADIEKGNYVCSY